MLQTVEKVKRKGSRKMSTNQLDHGYSGNVQYSEKWMGRTLTRHTKRSSKCMYTHTSFPCSD